MFEERVAVNVEEGRKLKSRFVKKIQGGDFVLFEGLLDLAHGEGLKRVETELVSVPTAENGHTAIVRAVVETEKGTFTGLGDASPASAEGPMRPHLVRLAETRAVARAFRLAVNVGTTAFEELGGSAGEEPENGENASEGATWLEKPGEIVLSFGKHVDKTLGEVLSEDRGYVEWLSKEAYDYVLRSAAKKLLEDNPKEEKPAG